MKVNQFGAAQQAIQSYLGQTKQADAKPGVAAIQKADAKPMAPISQLTQQVIGQQPDPILDRPPAMRYGILPPPPQPEDPVIALRYGLMPPAPEPDNPPIALRYGIMPPMPVAGDDE